MIRVNTPLPTNPQAFPPSVSSSPPAKRFKFSSWLHARTFIGIGLILASLIVSSVIFAKGDDTAEVWAASEDLHAGVTLTRSDVTKRSVSLKDTESLYLKASEDLVGKTLRATLKRGELLAKSAVSKEEENCGGLITVAVASYHVPTRISRGDYINLYTRGDSKLDSALVDKVHKPSSGVLSSSATWSLDLRLHSDAMKIAVTASQAKPEEIDVEISPEEGKHSNPCKKPPEEKEEKVSEPDSEDNNEEDDADATPSASGGLA